jgi:hypothetical protein
MSYKEQCFAECLSFEIGRNPHTVGKQIFISVINIRKNIEACFNVLEHKLTAVCNVAYFNYVEEHNRIDVFNIFVAEFAHYTVKY